MNSEHELQPWTPNTKRRRAMTGKGKEYEEQRMTSKKKKDYFPTMNDSQMNRTSLPYDDLYIFRKLDW